MQQCICTSLQTAQGKAQGKAQSIRTEQESTEKHKSAGEKLSILVHV